MGKVQHEAADRMKRLQSQTGVSTINTAVLLLNKEWKDDRPNWLVPYRNALYEAEPIHEVGRPLFSAAGPNVQNRAIVTHKRHTSARARTLSVGAVRMRWVLVLLVASSRLNLYNNTES